MSPGPQPTDEERLRGRLEPTDHPLMRQVWRYLGFLHWAVDPQAFSRFLPPGLQIDTFGAAAYVGIVPFTIPIARTVGLSIPVAPPFHEINLRTYVHRNGRSPGVWFFSLDAASWLAVLGARIAYRLPYFHARMSLDVTDTPTGPSIVYQSLRGTSLHTSQRHTTGGTHAAFFRGRYQPAGPVAVATPGTLEFFLVERYRLYASSGRHLSEARVHHAPYPLQVGIAADIDETLTSAAGLSQPARAPSYVHYAHEVDVRIYRPRRVTG